MGMEVYIDLTSKKQTSLLEVTRLIGTNHFLEPPSHLPLTNKYNFSQIYLIHAGIGVLTTEQGEYSLSPGMMFYVPAYKASCYQWFSSDVRYEIINFVCESEAMSVFEGAPLQLMEAEQLALQEVINTASKISVFQKTEQPQVGIGIREGTPSVVLCYITASLERFLALVYSRVTGTGIEFLTDESQKAGAQIERTELVSKVIRFLVENKGRKIKMEDICREFLLCRTALTQKFRKEMGMLPMEYLAEIRIREAMLRVRESSATFSEIADDLGFSSASYFCKAFKSKTGMTPTEFSRFVSKRRSIGK